MEATIYVHTAKTAREAKKTAGARQGDYRLRAAVRMIQRHNREVGIRQAYIKTEASGGVTLRNVRRIARTGVDSISIGALTHSPKALDISLEIE
ncbi:MAG: hypothetical protein NT030_06205 [Candidatus Saganbacteria bacterium]|nr:hypothetical protein [Candidatus Saganbacteria bacterium]